MDKRMMTFACGCALAMFCTSADAADKLTDSFKLAFVERTAKAPVIDGKLDEDVWKKATPITDFGPATICINTDYKVPQTEFRCLWDDKYLYVGMTCKEDSEENMRRFLANYNDRRVSFIWRDSVELHLDGNNDRKTKFQIWLNPTDEKQIIWNYDFGWGPLSDSNYGLNAEWEKKSFIGKDGWTVEARFALSHFEIKPHVGYIFAMEPVRMRWGKWLFPKPGKKSPEGDGWAQVLAWAMQGRSHHRTNEYGKFILVDEMPSDPAAGLRLAYPDLDRRTIYVETPGEYLVVDKGKASRLSFLDKGRELLKAPSAALKRYEQFVGQAFEPALPKDFNFKDVDYFLSRDRGAFRAAESNALAATVMDAPTITELQRTTVKWAATFETAYWRAVKKLLLAEKRVRVPVTLHPAADAPGKFDEEPERWLKPWERTFDGHPWAKNLAAKGVKTLVCADAHGAIDAWQLINRLQLDADVFQQRKGGLGSTSDYFNEGLMLVPAKRQQLERLLKENDYGAFVFLGTGINAWPEELQCWLYGRILDGAKYVSVNGGDPISGLQALDELARGNGVTLKTVVRDPKLVARGEDYATTVEVSGMAKPKQGAFGKGTVTTFQPGQAGAWCAATLLTLSPACRPEDCFQDELAMGVSTRVVMEGLGLRGARRALDVSGGVRDGRAESGVLLRTAGPAWSGDVVWNVRDTWGKVVKAGRLAGDFEAGTNHVTLAVPPLGAGTYSVEARLEQGGKLGDYAIGSFEVKPESSVKCGCGGKYCTSELPPPSLAEVAFRGNRNTFGANERITARVKVVSPGAAGLKVRAEIRDVRDRIVQRTVVPLDATKETVDVAFDPQLLEHSANFLDVYLETDRVLDVKRLDFYRRVGTRRDFTIFTEEAPGSGQYAAKRRAYYEYHGVDCWQTDSMRPTAQWQGGDLVIRDRIPGSAPDKGGSLSNPWWQKHLARRYGNHARALAARNGRFISLGDDSGAPNGFGNAVPDWFPAYVERVTAAARDRGEKNFRAPSYGQPFLDELRKSDMRMVVDALRDAYPTIEHANRHLGLELKDWKDVTPEVMRVVKPAKSPEYVNYLFWLRAKYKTVEALNKAWDAEVKDFFAIPPALADELQLAGKFGASIDRQTFLEQCFINQGKAIAKGVKSVDPTIGFGFGASTLGNTFADAIQQLNSVCPYAGTEQIELCRGVPHVFNGECMGVYGGKKVQRPTRERTVWHGLLAGCNFSWYWHGSYMIEGDGSVNPNRAGYMFNTYREVTRGPAALLRRSTFDNCGVRVLVNHASGRMAPIVKDMSTHDQARGAFELIANDLGYRWDCISTEAVEKGALRREGVKVLLMGYAQIVSPAEAAAIREFVKNGGVVIADARVATHDASAHALEKPLLDDVFGISHTQAGALVKRCDLQVSGLQPSTSNLQPSTFKGVLVDASIRAKGAKALAKADSAEAFFVNDFGKGKAVLMNVNLAAYAFLRDRGELGGVRDAIASLFSLGAGPARFTTVSADGRAVAGVEYTRYVRGAMEIVGVEKLGLGCEKFPMPVKVKIGAKKHVYDVRKGTYVGETDAIPMTFTGLDVALYSMLPYAVKGVSVDAPASVTRGEVLAIRAAVDAGGAKGLATHVLRVELIPPSGVSPERFAPVQFQLKDAKDGKLETAIQTAFNDETGNWTLIVTDVATGVSAKKTIVVKQ